MPATRVANGSRTRFVDKFHPHCFDPSPDLTNGNNCISDTDLQNEIKKVMTLKAWTGGLNKMFLLFTSSDEGQCVTSATNCSYSQYCAYYSSFVNGSGQSVIYGNEPYGDVTRARCLAHRLRTQIPLPMRRRPRPATR
jgi:hypothetical protein